MERLIKDEILLDLEFSNLYSRLDYIKGKLTTNVRNVKVDRCTELLGVIPTYICGSFTSLAMVATNISLRSLMIILVMVLSSSIVRSLILWRLSKLKLSSNNGRRSKWFIITEVVSTEYYGRYDETRRNPEPFAKYLQECGIDAHYTMSGTPQHNGIVEMRNRMLLDMV